MILFTNFFLTIGITIIVVIIMILAGKKEKELPHFILISIFILFLFVAFNSYSEINGIKTIYRISYIFTDAVGFLLGPLIFHYIKSIYQHKIALKHLRHFIPAGLYILFISIPFFVSSYKGSYVFYYLNLVIKYDFLLQIQVVYLLIYTFFSLKILKEFQDVVKGQYSSLNNKDLKWVRNFLYGIIIIMVVNIATELYALFKNQRLSLDNTLTTLAMIAVILYLGYFGTKQSRILLPIHRFGNRNVQPKKEIIHHLSNTSENEINELEARLMAVLDKEKPYENGMLNLEMLAEMIPTTDRKLSALLNHKLNISFYDLINSYRVQAVKKKMEQKEFEKYTLVTIAYDAGFNSKSSFNRIFKKHTGRSPSAYKKELQSRTN